MRSPVISGDTSGETWLLEADIAAVGGVLTQVIPAIWETGSLPGRFGPPEMPRFIERRRLRIQGFDHSPALRPDAVRLPGCHHALGDYIFKLVLVLPVPL